MLTIRLKLIFYPYFTILINILIQAIGMIKNIMITLNTMIKKVKCMK